MLKKTNTKLLWAFGFIILLVISYFSISFLIASYITSPTAKHIDVAPNFVSTNYQNASFKTSDNLTLKGWLFNPKATKFVIFVPGFLDNRTNGGYYGVDLTRELIAQNIGVLLYDPRARGDSEGKIRLKDENLDVVGAVNFLKSKGVEQKNIYILSYSTGARATLLTLPDIQGIGGIVVDSTPINMKSVLRYVVTVEQHLPGLLLPGVYFWLETKNINLGDEQILKNVSNSKIPLLVIHAQNDLSVPLQNSKDIINANKNGDLIIFPNGSHIEAYKFNPDMYRKVLFDFLNKN